jgi:IS5 family transposase
VIVDTTVQEKAIAHPVDSRLLEIARHKVVSAAKRAGIASSRPSWPRGKELRRKAGGYAHAKQFKRLKKTVKRQRTILGRGDARGAAQARRASPGRCRRRCARRSLRCPRRWGTEDVMQRAERIRTQQRHDKNKLYALHAPGGRVHRQRQGAQALRVRREGQPGRHAQARADGGRPSFPGNPFDGHTWPSNWSRTSNLLQDLGRKPTQAIVDLGFRGRGRTTTRASRSSTAASSRR